MANFEMSVPHHLTQEEALQRIQNLLVDAKKEHSDKISNLKENWSGNTGEFSLTIMGFSISGKLAVTSSAVDISATLPFAASLFKGKIEELLTEKAEKLLS
ncbi:MAG: polyhydroxyalkanoic acid system family protein [Sediminibacterium sp.]